MRRRVGSNEIFMEAPDGSEAVISFAVRYVRSRFGGGGEIEVDFVSVTLEHSTHGRRVLHSLEEAEKSLGELGWAHDAVAAKADPCELMAEDEADDADYAIDAWKERDLA